MAEGLLHDSGPYLQDAELVWAHMVRVGPLARGLARGFDVPSHEAFLLGLLHDVGKLVLFDLLSAVRRDLRREVALPERLAADALRDLHEPLGGLALLRWGVDPRAAWAVAHHHRRDPSLEPGRRSELLYVAERLDAARVRRQPVDAERWAAEGRLTVPVARVRAAVERAPRHAAARGGGSATPPRASPARQGAAVTGTLYCGRPTASRGWPPAPDGSTAMVNCSTGVESALMVSGMRARSGRLVLGAPLARLLAETSSARAAVGIVNSV
jgi:HD superfamily phosphohydrolase YqeK